MCGCNWCKCVGVTGSKCVGVTGSKCVGVTGGKCVGVIRIDNTATTNHHQGDIPA